MRDIFISYTSKNKEIVDSVIRELDNRKISYWIDSEEMQLTKSSYGSISAGLRNSIVNILLITKDYLSSHWVLIELIQMLSPIGNQRVIPIFFDDSKDDFFKKYNFMGDIIYIKNELTLEEKIIKIEKYILEFKSKTMSIKDNDDLMNILEIFIKSEGVFVREIVNNLQKYISLNINDEYLKLILANNIINDALKLMCNKTDIIFDDDNMYKKLNEFYNSDITNKIKVIRESTISYARKSICENFNITRDLNDYLHDILLWLNEQILKNESQKPKLAIIKANELEEIHFYDMYEIDKLTLKSNMISPPNITLQWQKHNKYSHIGVIDQNTKKIVGYIAAFPINDEFCNILISGKFSDVELGIENILTYDIPGVYTLYVDSIAIHPNYQGSIVFFLLINALIEMMLELSQHDIYINEFWAEAGTSVGLNYCRRLGMIEVARNHRNNSLIFKSNLIPPIASKLFLIGKGNGKLLREIYSDAFINKKELLDL